jgi:hypothetical protein
MFSIDSVVRQKSLYLDCHSGLDPESSISELDSRWSLPRTLIRGGNDETSGVLYAVFNS